MYACSSIQSVLRLTFFIQTCRRKLARRLSTSSFSDKSSGATGVGADAAACADACAGDSDLDEGSWDALERIISRQVSKVVQDNFKLEADHQFQDALLVWFVQFGKQLFKCLCVIQTSPHPWCVSPYMYTLQQKIIQTPQFVELSKTPAATSLGRGSGDLAVVSIAWELLQSWWITFVSQRLRYTLECKHTHTHTHTHTHM